jgi:peroxiredoxin Q/BCP
LQAAYAQFHARKAEILAVAVQDVSRAQVMDQIVQADYPILADADHAVADAYGVFNLLGDGVATPSVFIIDPAGRIVWSYVGKDANDRPSAEDVLTHVP